jgi:hypothetical protein
MSDHTEAARHVLDGLSVGASLIPGGAGPIVATLLRALSAMLHKRSPEEALRRLRELAQEDVPHVDAAKVAEDAIAAVKP